MGVSRSYISAAFGSIMTQPQKPRYLQILPTTHIPSGVPAADASSGLATITPRALGPNGRVPYRGVYIANSPVRRTVRQHHRLAVVLLVRRLCLVPLAPAVGLRPRLGLTRHVASTQHLVPINCLLGTHTPRGKPRVPPLKRSKGGVAWGMRGGGGGTGA